VTVSMEHQLLDRSFRPPYFIMQYPTESVTWMVGVVINLPSRVASHDINDVAVWLDKNSMEFVIQVNLHSYMTWLKFSGQLGKAIGPDGNKKYKKYHMSIFQLHLQMYQTYCILWTLMTSTLQPEFPLMAIMCCMVWSLKMTGKSSNQRSHCKRLHSYP